MEIFRIWQTPRREARQWTDDNSEALLGESPPTALRAVAERRLPSASALD